jgi:hypothetical protein
MRIYNAQGEDIMSAPYVLSSVQNPFWASGSEKEKSV